MKTRLLATLFSSIALAAAETPAAPVKTKITADEKVVILPVPAEEAPTEPSAPPEALPTVEASIPDAVKALAAPATLELPGGIQMAVTAISETAQTHVNQGLNHLHGGWEFEASRHFAAAMREDPDCLLAHWGMVMALLTPSPENGEVRNAATDRLLALVDQGKGTELERGLAYGLIKYIQEGPAGAAAAFRKVSEKFPNDLQASIFAALFGRSGYDELGNAKPDQEAAEKSLLALIEKSPQSPLPLYALLSIRAEAPDLSPSLDLARKLCQLAPDYAPYFHLLGHYEWRCGNHAAAAAAFGRASSHYERWMKENQATLADCPDWVKSECYRIVAIASKGDFTTATAAARQIAASPIPKNRIASPGARILLWDAKTLPARLILAQDLPGKCAEALKSLPKPEELRETRETSLAFWWIDGIRLSLEAQRLIEAGEMKDVQDVIAALTHHGEAMSRTQAAATASGERSPWTRSYRALEVLVSDVHGRQTLAGPKERIGTAYNWFASAADRQQPAPFMFPPLILTPMAVRLGQFYLITGKPAEAIEAYQRALATFPNHHAALAGLQKAYAAAELPAGAAATAEKLRVLKAP